jgi:hypothetical protein
MAVDIALLHWYEVSSSGHTGVDEINSNGVVYDVFVSATEVVKASVERVTLVGV